MNCVTELPLRARLSQGLTCATNRRRRTSRGRRVVPGGMHRRAHDAITAARAPSVIEVGQACVDPRRDGVAAPKAVAEIETVMRVARGGH